MKRNPAFLLATVLTVALARGASCDYTPAPPAERSFASAKGTQRFRLTAHDEGTLVRLGRSGKEEKLWKTHLVCQPQTVFVPDHPRRLVTIDQWGARGFKHCVVVYGSKGEPLADYSLEDLLSRDEIRRKVFQTSSNRAWTAAAQFTLTRRRLRIDFRWRLPEMNVCGMEWVYPPGRRLIEIDINTGRIVKLKVFPDKVPAPHASWLRKPSFAAVLD